MRPLLVGHETPVTVWVLRVAAPLGRLCMIQCIINSLMLHCPGLSLTIEVRAPWSTRFYFLGVAPVETTRLHPIIHSVSLWRDTVPGSCTFAARVAAWCRHSYWYHSRLINEEWTNGPNEGGVKMTRAFGQFPVVHRRLNAHMFVRLGLAHASPNRLGQIHNCNLIPIVIQNVLHAYLYRSCLCARA